MVRLGFTKKRYYVVFLVCIGLILGLCLYGSAVVIHGSAVDIQESRYDKESFNCWNMSWELAGFFDKLGFDSVVVTGVYVDESRNIHAHAWVRVCGVDVESTKLCLGDIGRYTVVGVYEVE